MGVLLGREGNWVPIQHLWSLRYRPMVVIYSVLFTCSGPKPRTQWKLGTFPGPSSGLETRAQREARNSPSAPFPKYHINTEKKREYLHNCYYEGVMLSPVIRD